MVLQLRLKGLGVSWDGWGWDKELGNVLRQ